MNRLQKAAEKTLNAVYLLLTFWTRPDLKPAVKEQLPSPTKSMCICTFDCSCGASYVGRKTRQLSKRLQEHIPNWFSKGQQKSIDSFSLAHVVDQSHQVDTQKAFKVIYRMLPQLHRGLRVRLLHTRKLDCGDWTFRALSRRILCLFSLSVCTSHIYFRNCDLRSLARSSMAHGR